MGLAFIYKNQASCLNRNISGQKIRLREKNPKLLTSYFSSPPSSIFKHMYTHRHFKTLRTGSKNYGHHGNQTLNKNNVFHQVPSDG